VTNREDKLIWESYINARLTFSLELYYKLLNEYLITHKQWHLKQIDNKQIGIYQADDLLGKMESVFNAKTKTIRLDHIAASFDADGKRRIGLNLLKTIYTFEKSILSKYDINYVCVDPMNQITKKIFNEIFGSDYEIKRSKNKWCAIIAPHQPSHI
jgi:hypothetical protein